MQKKIAKPFLKWAGGKTQLIQQIAKSIPLEFKNTEFTYIEPFVGSGAFLFWMLNNYPNMNKVIINDINSDLINTYNVIAKKPKELISTLKTLEKEFNNLNESIEKKKEYYYNCRRQYNLRNNDLIAHAALFIFLNRTCFNGLYRVNKNNEFNVPIGTHKKNTICDEQNLSAVSEALKKVEILCGDFESTIKYASSNSLFYFDPPYKPLNKTSQFNSYSNQDFNDNEQIRLRDFCNKLEILNSRWILSNSNPECISGNGNFFDSIYSNSYIKRVKVKRIINSKIEKRGQLMELLIVGNNHNTLIKE